MVRSIKNFNPLFSYHVKYSIYSSRLNDDPINLADARGSISFIWANEQQFASPFDPRYITFDIMLATNNEQDFTSEQVQSAELETLHRDHHPQYFEKGTYAYNMASMSGDGSTNIYTLKHPD